MGATSQTVNYTTIAALALDKLSDKIADAVSTSNAIFYFSKKKGNWEGIDYGGRQLRKTVLWQLQTVRPLGSYGVVNVNPVDGHTSVYFDWGQTAVPVSFSDMEEFQTGGSESIESIVKAKYDQAVASLDDFMSRAIIRGQADIDTTSLTTAITSPVDSSTFALPLGKLIAFDPTASLTIGGVDQSTNSWFQNQYVDSSSTTLAGFLHDLRTVHVRCQRGGGKQKAPDYHFCDETTYNIYEKALALYHRNDSYAKADIPFENVSFKGQPVIADQLIADVKSGSTSITYGTWYMLNSEYVGFTYDKRKSFKLGDQVRPDNQLVTTALMPVRGAFWTNNRRKLGVVGDIRLSSLASATT